MSKADTERVTANQQHLVAHYAAQWQRFRASPLEWVYGAMRTRNEDAAPGQPRHALPVPDLPHVRVFVAAYFRERRLLCDKSRQMMVTWLLCGLNVWECMFLEACRNSYQNMSLRETCEKLENYMLYILEHQPQEVMLPWVKGNDAPPKAWIELVALEVFGRHVQDDGTVSYDQDAARKALTPPTAPGAKDSPYLNSRAYHIAKALSNTYHTTSGSEGIELIEFYPFFDPTLRLLEAIPGGASGADKHRGATRRRSTLDECFFFEKLADNVTNSAKSVGQHGFQTLVSTASMGKDGDEYPLKMIQPADTQPTTFPDPPHLGLSYARTRQGYFHLRIHYTADPSKRSRAFYQKNVLDGDRAKNLREMEIRYDSPEGDPFYSMFQGSRSGIASLRVNPHTSSLLIGLDGGRSPAAVICEYGDEGRVVATFEVLSENVSIEAHALKVEATLERHYPGWRGIHTVFYDPSMDQKSEQTDLSAAYRLRKRGWNLQPGEQDPDVRFQALAALLEGGADLEDGHGIRPRLIVDIQRCETLFKALDGACETDPGAGRSGLNRKKKNRYSHVVEALEYIATRITSARPKAHGLKVFRTQRRGAGAH